MKQNVHHVHLGNSAACQPQQALVDHVMWVSTAHQVSALHNLLMMTLLVLAVSVHLAITVLK